MKTIELAKLAADPDHDGRVMFPAAWDTVGAQARQDEAPQALIAYACDGLGERVSEERGLSRPETAAEYHADGAAYYVYADGSLWYSNNACDEVWMDKGDFLAELLDSIRMQKLGWTELDRMDRGFLAAELDGKTEARKAIGDPAVEV